MPRTTGGVGKGQLIFTRGKKGGKQQTQKTLKMLKSRVESKSKGVPSIYKLKTRG